MVFLLTLILMSGPAGAREKSPVPVKRWVIGFNQPQHAYQKIGLEKMTNLRPVNNLPFALVMEATTTDIKILLKRLRTSVLWIEEDVVIPVQLKWIPNDPLYETQWPLHTVGQLSDDVSMHLETAWDTTLGKKPDRMPVKIAVVDDGFDLLHPDLKDRFIAPGFDISAGVIDDDPTFDTNDIHGTRTSGLIAATANNSEGIAGVCPECSLLPVRLIGGGGPNELFVTGSAAATAITWAVDHGADVINNSWGPPDGNPRVPQHDGVVWKIPKVVDEAIRYTVKNGRGGLGSIIVWSSGNGGELMSYDGFANHPSVVAVGAIDSAGRRAYYSDFGHNLLLVAPSSGESRHEKITTTDIRGLLGDNNTDYSAAYGGTSAAGAMVAGIAGLIIAAYPNLTAAQVIEAMLLSATPVDTQYGNYVDGHSRYYGYGRIDATGALSLAATYHDACTLSFELCGNEKDDDCDGSIDNDTRCSICIPGLPNEICDGKDNNCDGLIDEDFVCSNDRPVCAPCKTETECMEGAVCYSNLTMVGNCCLLKCTSQSKCPEKFTCINHICLPNLSGVERTCRDLLTCKESELCDGIDNDCNQIIDDVETTSSEYLTQTDFCNKQKGVCANQPGHCANGHWDCETPETYEKTETLCDGLDNDCDSLIDEYVTCPPQPPREDKNVFGCSTRASTAMAQASGFVHGLFFLLRKWRRVLSTAT